MPLYVVEDLDHPIDSVPYEQHFRAIRARIKNNDYEDIVAALNAKIDGDEIHTSSWMPGSDWYGTVYWPIYVACRENEEVAAKFFGQVVWTVFMDRPEDWASGRYEKNGVPLSGRTYFRITRCRP